MVPQEHGQVHRVGVIIPLVGQGDNRWIQFAIGKLADWFGIIEVDMGTLWIGEDGVERTMPTAMVWTLVDTLSDLTLARVFGLGMMLDAQSRRSGVAVVVDDDILIL